MLTHIRLDIRCSLFIQYSIAYFLGCNALISNLMKFFVTIADYDIMNPCYMQIHLSMIYLLQNFKLMLLQNLKISDIST